MKWPAGSNVSEPGIRQIAMPVTETVLLVPEQPAQREWWDGDGNDRPGLPLKARKSRPALLTDAEFIVWLPRDKWSVVRQRSDVLLGGLEKGSGALVKLMHVFDVTPVLGTETDYARVRAVFYCSGPGNEISSDFGPWIRTVTGISQYRIRVELARPLREASGEICAMLAGFSG